MTDEDSRTGPQEPKRAVQASEDTDIYTLSLSPNDRLVATGDKAGYVKLWKTETLEEKTRELLHDGAVWSLAFSPDGASLAAACSDGSVRIIDSDESAASFGSCVGVFRDRLQCRDLRAKGLRAEEADFLQNVTEALQEFGADV